MKEVMISRVTELEQLVNTRLLTSFQFHFSSNDCYNLREILHPNGVFFGKMNREKACGYFHNIFYGKGGTSEKFHMEINTGIALDRYPGEFVMEIRCSSYDPFTDDIAMVKKPFGANPDPKIHESVFRFAFSFKQDKIYTIRIPGKCISDPKPFIENN
jgi:hypothetical protein